MSGRDKDRFYPIPRAQDHSYCSIPFDQREVASSTRAQLLVGADQAALGAANGREVQEEAEMGSDAHGPGMSDPLPVDENQIRLCVQLGKSFQQDWPFTEGEESRDIGECSLAFSRPTFHKD